MRLVLMLAVVGACLAGAALAQEGGVLDRWARRPEARHVASAYPDRARDAGVAGYSLLCCTPRADRRLDCEVVVDWPRGYDFGDASQRMAREFRLNEQYQATLVGDARIRLGFAWQYGGSTPEVEAALAQIHEATKATCTPPGVEAAPGVDDITITTSRIMR